MTPVVASVHRSATHSFSKPAASSLHLIAGLGIEGDAHAGATVQHRSRVARDATQPNLRQVHLIHGELYDQLNARGFIVSPGQMGENITTRGLDILALPANTRLHIGAEAVIEVTGLRNPCSQLDDFRPGLMQAVLARNADGNLVRLAGIMAVVLTGGEIRPGDGIAVALPAGPRRALEVV